MTDTAIVLQRPESAPPSLNIMTVSKADHWVDDVLPRFAAYVDAHCTGPVRRHLLLIDNPSLASDHRRRILDRLEQRWHSVVLRPPLDVEAGQRLLSFDALRAGLLSVFGLSEGLYLDPDTDVVGDLQGLPQIAPGADLLWVANALPLEPVLADLRRHGFSPPVEMNVAVTLEPGFLYLRQDFAEAYAELRCRYPDVHSFVPGSTYWNMLMLSLGERAVRLPDEYNRTFWDVPAAVGTARSVHFTGQWKRLQPWVSYDRRSKKIELSDRPAPWPLRPNESRANHLPRSLSVVAILRDCADYLPHALARFSAWERRGLSIRYTFLENDSFDRTPTLLRQFMEGRRGRLECKRLAVRYDRTRAAQTYARVMPLAAMRNHALDMARSIAGADDEWTLLLDADIVFSEDVLDRIFASLDSDPAADTIGMVCAYSQQLFHREQVPRVGRPVSEWPGWLEAGHYYDTFAFQDQYHHSHRPFCAFARCRFCARSRPESYPLPLIPDTLPVVDVAAAFGGFALIPTAIISLNRLGWSTYAGELPEARSLCEHVVFCDRLRTLTGRRVVVCQNVDCVYRLPGQVVSGEGGQN